jgi:hypothetical protein
MPLTNAEKQKRWRDRRNRLIAALTDTPRKAAETILAELGVEQAGKVAKALEQRLHKRAEPPKGKRRKRRAYRMMKG